MLTIIKGLTGAGKTTYIKDLIKNQNKKIIYLVPEQVSFESEKSFFEEFTLKTYHNIEILSFTRLNNFIFRQLGGISKKILTKQQQLLKVFYAIKKNSAVLKVYNNQVSKENFTLKAFEIITEFRHLNLDPIELSRVIDLSNDLNFKLKMTDILLIYIEYLKFIDDDETDEIEDIKRATEYIKNKNFFSDYVIYIDSFISFSAIEIEMIKEILLSCEDVFITAMIDNLDTDNMIFKESKNNLKKIITLSKQCGHNVKIEALDNLHRYKSNTLKNINKYLAVGESDKFENDGSFKIYKGNDKYDTVNFIGATINDLIKNNEYRYKDIVILSGDFEEYQLPLKKTFGQYKIPFFIDKNENVINKPIIYLVLNILKIIDTNFDPELVLNYMKSPFLNIDEKDYFCFENYVYVWNIRKSDFLLEFSNNPRGFKPSFTDKDKIELKRSEKLRQDYVLPLLKIKESFNNLSGKNVTKAIYDFLENLNISKNIDK
ncbi:MAG: PD-(D/E)XK nuclease family protein, partial [Oscillospiraceae bacterium]